MKKYYEEKKYNLAFEKCVSVMARLMQENGRTVLAKIAIEKILIATERRATEQLGWGSSPRLAA